jgi:hypothetical protein
MSTTHALTSSTRSLLSTTAVALAATLAMACGGSVDPAPSANTSTSEGRSEILEGGSALAVVRGLHGAHAVLAFDGRVYVSTKGSSLGGVTSDNGTIMSIDLGGDGRGATEGKALQIALDRFGAGYEALATDGRDIIWSASDGRILAVSALGGEARTLRDAGDPVVAIAADPGAVYFLSRGKDDARGALYRIARTTRETTKLLDLVAPQALTLSTREIFVASRGDGANTGIIQRVDLATGTNATLATGQAAPCGLALADDRLVWTNAGAAPMAGEVMGWFNGAVQPLARGQMLPCAVTTDGSVAVWAPSASTRAPLMRASLEGGVAKSLPADGVSFDRGSVSMSGEYIYWASGDAVFRARK